MTWDFLLPPAKLYIYRLALKKLGVVIILVVLC